MKQTKLIDFGKRSGLKVHPVSIGAMRLPEDEEQAAALLRQAIDAGMTYIDTSRGYGDSEIKVGKALKDGYRQKVILSTKCSPWIKKVEPDDDSSADCTYKRIIESMERLDTDYIDFYQIWNIDSFEHYQMAVAKGGMLDGIRRAMDEGLVGHTGFTTHDSTRNIRRYINEADWCETILCGISKPSDITSTLEHYQKPPLTKEEIEELEKATKKISSKNMGFCTGCKYCMPCPQDINIPSMMMVSYLANMLQVPRKAKDIYNWNINEANPEMSAVPSSCIECGQCEQKCTQHLKIMQEMKRVREQFE